MAEKDKAFDVSKMGDTVIRGRDSDEKPELPSEGSQDAYQALYHPQETIESGHGATTSLRDMEDKSFDVSKIGDTVIRDRDSDFESGIAPRQVSTQEPSSEEEHPYKFQEPPQKIRTHSFHWKTNDQAFDISKMGDTVIRGRESDAKETARKESSSEEEQAES